MPRKGSTLVASNEHGDVRPSHRIAGGVKFEAHVAAHTGRGLRRGIRANESAPHAEVMSEFVNPDGSIRYND